MGVLGDPDLSGAQAGLPPLSAFAETLTWAAPSPLAAHGLAAYDRLLAARCAALLQRDGEAQIVADALDLMPEDRRRYILRAPSFAEQLLRPDGNGRLSGEAMVRALVAELAALGFAPEVGEEVWSARGDFCIRPDHPTVSGPDCLAGSGMVVDFASPITYSCDPRHSFAALAPGERDGARVRIADALVAISQVAAPAYAFCTQSVDVVVVRTAADRPPTALMSNSSAQQPRSVLLVNPHLPTIRNGLIADGLVHEAIHCLLFMFEHVSGTLMVADGRRTQLHVTSPWSGRALQLISYVHACIVWYGLYWFWSAAQAGGWFGVEECRKERSLILAGFAQAPVSRGLDPCFPFLRDDVKDLLLEIESRMRTQSA